MTRKKFRVIIGALISLALVALIVVLVMIQALVPWGKNDVTIFNNLFIFTFIDLALVFWLVIWNAVFKKIPNRKFVFADLIIKKRRDENGI